MCLQGASRVAAATEDFAGLRTLIVWVPMLPPDTLKAAEAAAQAFPEAAQFWDGDRRLAADMGRRLGITSRGSVGAPDGDGLAWDVYLAYGRGKDLGDQPDFWMHQLALDHAPRLDPAEFRRRVERLLSIVGADPS